MNYLNYTFELLAGGYYKGNSSWNKKHTEVDNCFKLYYLTEGEAHICDKNNKYILQSHKMYFINGNKLDYQYCSNSFSTHWIHFLPKDLLIYRGLLSLPTVVETTPHPQNNLNAAYALLEKSHLPVEKIILNKLELQYMLLNVIIELYHMYSINISEDIDKIEKITPAIQHINIHFKETIRLKDLAKLCCMSETYFHKTFKKVLDITPMAYQIRLKMNTALVLLNNSGTPIKEIADELGFTDASHFCNTFKLYYGITPKEYQKHEKETLIL